MFHVPSINSFPEIGYPRPLVEYTDICYNQDMTGVEEIIYRTKPIAIVYRHDIPVDGVAFLTSDKNSFQIGIQERPKKLKLPPHSHPLKKPIKIKEMQEILYVISGKIQVNLFTKTGKSIQSVILETGDSILLMREAHGVDFLEDSRLFEVKQGPFQGKKGKLFLSS